MDVILEELEAASRALRALDARRKGQLEYRDDVIRRALDAGVSWATLRQVTGLSARGLQVTVQRVRTRQ